MKASFFNLLIKSGFAILLFVMMSQQSYGQILKDRGKLKTIKSGGGFILFERKVKTESPRNKNPKKQNVHARFSKQSGKIKKSNVKPGFSVPLFGGRIKSASPRFSKKRFVPGNRNVSTRFTPAKKSVKRSGGYGYTSKRREALELAESPRYSAKPRKLKKYGVSPRYSTSKGGAIELAEAPRYSAKPNRRKKFGVSPRYSPARGEAIELAEAPRFSAKPNRKKKFGVSPRYSPVRGEAIELAEAPRYSAKRKRKKKAVVEPRYSSKKSEGVIEPYPIRYSEVDKRRKKTKVSPLYSDQSKRNYKIIYKPGFTVFDYLLAIPGGVILAVRPHDESIAQFKGWLNKKDVDRKSTSNSDFQGNQKRNIRIVKNFRDKRRAKNLQAYNGNFKKKTAFFEKMASKKRSNLYSDIVVPSGYNKRRKLMHPSAVNLTVKRSSTKTGKEIVKRTSRFWTKIDGNKNQPRNVRGRTKKLKFDKKEKGLWYE